MALILVVLAANWRRVEVLSVLARPSTCGFAPSWVNENQLLFVIALIIFQDVQFFVVQTLSKLFDVWFRFL